MSEYEITQSTNTVWGYTSVRAKIESAILTFQVPGAAEVTTTAYGFKVLATGASVRTAYHIFRYDLKEAIPVTLEHNAIGASVLKWNLKEQPIQIQPRLGCSFAVAIGPSDLIISNDDGERLSQAFRAPLSTIAGLTLEMLLRPPPAELPLFSAATVMPPAKLLTSA